jgi:hypothetical protein
VGFESRTAVTEGITARIDFYGSICSFELLKEIFEALGNAIFKFFISIATRRGRAGTDWIHVAPDRDQWKALVDTAMNIWVSHNSAKYDRSF